MVTIKFIINRKKKGGKKAICFKGKKENKKTKECH